MVQKTLHLCKLSMRGAKRNSSLIPIRFLARKASAPSCCVLFEKVQSANRNHWALRMEKSHNRRNQPHSFHDGMQEEQKYFKATYNRQSRTRQRNFLYLFSSVTNLTFDRHTRITKALQKCLSKQVRFTIEDFCTFFLTIVKAFYYTNSQA